MTNQAPVNPERSFGVSVGIVLCVIGALLVWRGRVVRAEVIGGIGAVLVVLGWLRPKLLAWPSAIWWRFSRALGYMNARILLTVLFALLLTPLSVFWRLTGRDPLNRRRGKLAGWSTYPARYRDRKHYDRMY